MYVPGKTGSIIDRITEQGFHITAVEMFHMEKANAEEFYEVYRGVVPEYPGMVEQLTSGPCIAMEIRAQDPVRAFREAAGPADPVSAWNCVCLRREFSFLWTQSQ